MSEGEKEAFFSLGTQYYVTARFSACAGLVPVCGNLFHHAIEMYLKGCLSSKLGLAELKDFNHRLQEIWNRFKLEMANPTLNRFDQVISELNRFESIRYPDRILSHGMLVSVSFVKRDSTPSNPNPALLAPTYELFVEEIDKLVKIIFEKASVNPRFFTNSLNSDAKIYLNKWNNTLLE